MELQEIQRKALIEFVKSQNKQSKHLLTDLQDFKKHLFSKKKDEALRILNNLENLNGKNPEFNNFVKQEEKQMNFKPEELGGKNALD